MSVSVVITTFNEQENIARLLESLASGSLVPNEVVIADSNSRDNTKAIIKKLQPILPFKVRLLSKKTNRSQGRNLAISKANNPIIAVTDAGCIVHKHWLKIITQPLLHDRADVVAGYYTPVTTTPFQQCVAPFVAVMPDQFDLDTFLPSSRSVAFTKKAWSQAGKYPEHLNYCEDLVFAANLKNNNRMVVKKGAQVCWIQATTFVQFFWQIAHYAQGDVEARYGPHLIKIASVFIRYLVFAIFRPLFIIYLLWSIFKHHRYINHSAKILLTPLLQITSDLAVIFGTLMGVKSILTSNSN